MPFLDFLRVNAAWLTAGLVLTLTSSFGQTFFISIFAGQIRAEFGLSHGQWGGIYTLGTTASAILMVWAGTLTDRYRVRSLGVAVLGLLALSCLFMASVPALWALPLAIFALRFTGQGMTSHIAVVAMARWFVAARGRALSIATLGFSLGEALLPITFVALMGLFSWRSLWVLAAGLVLLMIPLLLGLLRQERIPSQFAEGREGLGMESRHWRRSEVLRHPLFWLAVPMLLGPAAFNTALFFHQVHLTEVKGWAHVQFVALFPVYTATSIVAMLASGWAIDRFGSPRLMPWVLLPLATGFFLLGRADSLFAAAVAMVFVGVTSGANATLSSAFWAEFFGTRHLGAIKSMAAAIMVFGSAIGPGLTGALIDLGLAFPDQMLGIAVYFVLAAALLTLGVRNAAGSLPPAA